MKFSVENCKELINKDFEKEVSAFKKRNGTAPDAEQVENLKALVGYETIRNYVDTLEESVARASANPSTVVLASKVANIRAQWNATLEASVRAGTNHKENLQHFIEYAHIISSTNSVMLEALESFLKN